MKTWVLIAALAAVALTADLQKDQIRKVLRTWNHKEGKKYVDVVSEKYTSVFEEVPELLDTHRISKREVSPISFAAAAVTRGCTKPGYTGETCQYPLCSQRAPGIPNDDSTDQVTIDAQNLANCSESMVVLVDETMWDILIEVETESPLNPTFYLQYEDGTLIFPDSDAQRPTYYTAHYTFLAPGQYLIGPRADTGENFCTMMMSSRTSLKVTGGFTSGDQAERNDFPTLRYAYFDTESVVAIHAQGLEYPGVLSAVGFTGAENHITRYISLGTRFNCTYPYLLERYTCHRTSNNDLGHNYFQVEGVTNAGYKFRRVVAYQCILPPVATTLIPPTTPAPLTSCLNGGQLLTDTDGSAYCYCFGLFTGRDCGTLVCDNGGYLATPTSQTCTCPEGFSGLHCSNIICSDTTGLSFDAEHPTLTLVIRSRYELSNVIEQVKDATQELVDLMTLDSDYLTSFIVVLFDNNMLLSSKRYTSWDEVLTDLTKAIHSAPTDGGCEDAVFSSIAAALSLYPNNKSPLYVITDANPNDSIEKETVFHLESYWRAPTYFLYVPPAPADNCNTSPDNSGYRDYIDIATRTSGNVFYISNRTAVQGFLTQHYMNTFYYAQLALSGDYTHCGQQNLYKSVIVDQDNDILVVIATGTNLTLVVTDPFANHVEFDVSYNDGVNYIWSKRGSVSGHWFFTLLSSQENDACSLRVYQKKFNPPGHNAEFSPSFDIFWGFTVDITAPGEFRQPVMGFDASPVFHVTNYPAFITMDRVHANLQVYAQRDGFQVEVYGSSGIWRDGCEYNFYFAPFTCNIPNEVLYFNFFARDRFDQSIQRAGTMYCSQIHPTPQPDHACQNGGVMNPSNTSCFCPPQFTGTYCQTLVCYNGGTVNGDHCVCPPGYAGESCELPKCIETGPTPEFLSLGVDMVFAVEITQQSIASIVTLNANFDEILRDIHMQDRMWIRNFVLIGFNSTWGGLIAESPAENVTAITTALNTLASSIPTDTGCTVKLWDALNHAIFTREITPGSYIEVFQTTPEDDTDARSLGIFYEMSRSMELVIYGFLAASPRQTPNGFACNGTIENYYTLLGIVAGSTGNTYSLQPAELSNAVRLIPLQYSNGFVAFNMDNDCTDDDGLATYFPVDAYTQTIQLNVFGYGAAVSVYNGDGVLQEALELFYDDFTGQSVFEVRKACDDGWQNFGQSCLKFISGVDEILPMPAAKNFCASAGGFLVDDISDEKNSFLYSTAAKTQFWIGLYNNNSQWYWDRGQFFDPQPLSQNNPYWANNQPSTDASEQCVYFDGASDDSSKVWNSDSCSTPRAFVCQKHRYDQDFEPNRITDDDLAAGMWYARVKTAPKDATYTPLCTLGVRVQSSLQIITGYTTDVGSDFPAIDPEQDSSKNRLITYIHNIDNENRAPILTDAILLDAANGSFYNGLKYSARYGCNYGYVTQDFSCPNGGNQNNEFGVIHIGEDEFGHTFQRVTYGHCSKAVITCGNGGIRQNGACICNDYWTGSRCTVPICVNGGNRTADETSCICPSGYAGQNCQLEICQPNIPQLFSDDRKSVVFVVETTQQNAATVAALKTNLSSIVASSLTNYPIWFANYGLVTFDSTGRTFENFAFTSIDDVITALNGIALTDAGACSLPFLGVLGHLFEHNEEIVIPNSEIFLITSAGPSDLSEYVETMDNLFNIEAHLHYIYSQNANCPDYDSLNNVEDTAWLGYGSGGNILFTDPSNIVNLLSGYFPTLYGASILQNPTGAANWTCSDGNVWYVPVDYNTSTIYVTTTSPAGSLSAVNPLGATVAAHVVYNVNFQKVYALDVSHVPGIWSLSVVSYPGVCFAHIYSQGGVKVYTKFALTNPVGSIIDPTGAHQDGRMIAPVPGFENVAVFHLAGQHFHNGQLQYVEIFDADTVSNIIRSELYPRDGCSFEYYSDPFTCNSDMIVVFVHGVDEYNQQFRRQEVVICNGRTPPTGAPITGGPITAAPVTSAAPVTQPPVTQGPVTQPPVTQVPVTTTPSAPVQSTTTSRGYADIMFDVVFIIDGSQSAQDDFDSFTKFIQTLMVSFDVGQTGARVGLIVASGDDTNPMPAAAQLDSIRSQTSLNGNLAGLKDSYTDFDVAGQPIYADLGIANSVDYRRSGYRSTVNNHLIIYITSSTAFGTDPNALAQSILSSKTYGIITVGYGAAVDNTKLIALSGGSSCSFTATDFAGLNNQIKPIQSLIWNADSNGGIYCGV